MPGLRCMSELCQRDKGCFKVSPEIRIFAPSTNDQTRRNTMENQTITFDELIDLFEAAYAVDIDDRVMFVYLEETDEGDTYEIYLEDETLIIMRGDNEKVTKSSGPTYTFNIRMDWDDEPREADIRFLKPM